MVYQDGRRERAMIQVDSEMLNAKIAEICDDGVKLRVKGLESAGKCIAYIGWYWRIVDFNDQIILGYCPDTDGFLESGPGFVGFMENNKWGYDQWAITEEQADELKARLVAMFAAGVTQEALQGIFDYMQTLRREFVECSDCHGEGLTGGNCCKTCHGFGKVAKGKAETGSEELLAEMEGLE
jgi:hypothetical protein